MTTPNNWAADTPRDAVARLTCPEMPSASGAYRIHLYMDQGYIDLNPDLGGMTRLRR